MKTDEVCGRPLDSFASHVTMEKTGLGGTDDGSARGHSMQKSPTQSRERVKGGTPLLRLLVKKEKFFCKSSRNFRGSVEIYKHKDRERT